MGSCLSNADEDREHQQNKQGAKQKPKQQGQGRKTGRSASQQGPHSRPHSPRKAPPAAYTSVLPSAPARPGGARPQRNSTSSISSSGRKRKRKREKRKPGSGGDGGNKVAPACVPPPAACATAPPPDAPAHAPAPQPPAAVGAKAPAAAGMPPPAAPESLPTLPPSPEAECPFTSPKPAMTPGNKSFSSRPPLFRNSPRTSVERSDPFERRASEVSADGSAYSGWGFRADTMSANAGNTANTRQSVSVSSATSQSEMSGNPYRTASTQPAAADNLPLPLFSDDAPTRVHDALRKVSLFAPDAHPTEASNIAGEQSLTAPTTSKRPAARVHAIRALQTTGRTDESIAFTTSATTAYSTVPGSLQQSIMNYLTPSISVK